MEKKNQLKNIPEIPILKFLKVRHDNNLLWACRYKGYDNSITQVMPEWVSEKMVLLKMKSLINKGLVSGCYCGCRGDFEITKKGVEYLTDK